MSADILSPKESIASFFKPSLKETPSKPKDLLGYFGRIVQLPQNNSKVTAAESSDCSMTPSHDPVLVSPVSTTKGSRKRKLQFSSELQDNSTEQPADNQVSQNKKVSHHNRVSKKVWTRKMDVSESCDGLKAVLEDGSDDVVLLSESPVVPNKKAAKMHSGIESKYAGEKKNSKTKHNNSNPDILFNDDNDSVNSQEIRETDASDKSVKAKKKSKHKKPNPDISLNDYNISIVNQEMNEMDANEKNVKAKKKSKHKKSNPDISVNDDNDSVVHQEMNEMDAYEKNVKAKKKSKHKKSNPDISVNDDNDSVVNQEMDANEKSVKAKKKSNPDISVNDDNASVVDQEINETEANEKNVKAKKKSKHKKSNPDISVNDDNNYVVNQEINETDANEKIVKAKKKSKHKKSNPDISVNDDNNSVVNQEMNEMNASEKSVKAKKKSKHKKSNPDISVNDDNNSVVNQEMNEMDANEKNVKAKKKNKLIKVQGNHSNDEINDQMDSIPYSSIKSVIQDKDVPLRSPTTVEMTYEDFLNCQDHEEAPLALIEDYPKAMPITSFFSKVSPSQHLNAISIKAAEAEKAKMRVTVSALIHPEPSPPMHNVVNGTVYDIFQRKMSVEKKQRTSPSARAHISLNEDDLTIVELGSEIIDVEDDTNKLIINDNKHSTNKVSQSIETTSDIENPSILEMPDVNTVENSRRDAFLKSSEPLVSKKTAQTTLPFSKPGNKMEPTKKNSKNKIVTLVKLGGKTAVDPLTKSTTVKSVSKKSRKKKIIKAPASIDESKVNEQLHARRLSDRIKGQISACVQDEAEPMEEDNRRRKRKKKPRYKVTYVDEDDGIGSPLKIRIKRCNTSRSEDDFTPKSKVSRQQKSEGNAKIAKKLLRKAKAGKTSETQKRKTVKASPELPSRRRSSRLSSGHTSETADVIIVDDESCDVGKSKGTMKKTVKSKSLKKNADKCTPVKTAIGMTPQKPAREKTPKAKTSQKGVKLASIFSKTDAKASPATPTKVLLDPETLRIRREFLFSGIPDTLKRQEDHSRSAVLNEYPPLPMTSHVQQQDMKDIHWTLPHADLQLRPSQESSSLPCLKKFRTFQETRITQDEKLQYFEEFSSHPPLDSSLVRFLLGELSLYNPAYPYKRMYKSFLSRKCEAETNYIATGQKLIWTEKYQPGGHLDIIGNAGHVRKLSGWLAEWRRIAVKEAIKEKKNQKKTMLNKDASEWWADDDHDFDIEMMDSDSDEDEELSLCNTMLLTGPNGVGKTSTVYALAHELGYKVFEVNASSIRSGKQILAQLQEATQSHQVWKQNQEAGTGDSMLDSNCGTDPRIDNKLPTAFTNLFKKAEPVSNKPTSKRSKKPKTDIAEEHDAKSKKRKRDRDESEIKKRKGRRKSKDEDVAAAPKPAGLASACLILFDEVDVVFEEDKGFWSAIQHFMCSTKRPILLTASDINFVTKFEGAYEELHFKKPSIPTITSHLQVMCLAEGVRTESIDVASMVRVHNRDIRMSILSLQFWSESGAGVVRSQQEVVCPSVNPHPSSHPAHLFLDDNTTNSQSVSQSSLLMSVNNNKNDADDFVVQPKLSKRRRFIFDDESSLDSLPSTPVKSRKNGEMACSPLVRRCLTNSTTENSQDEDLLVRCDGPPRHRLFLESMMGVSQISHLGILPCLKNAMQESDPSHMRNASSTVATLTALGHNIVGNCAPSLFPLARVIVDSLHTLTCVGLIKPKEEIKAKKPSRLIRRDLFDSDSSSDAACFPPENLKDTSLYNDEPDIRGFRNICKRFAKLETTEERKCLQSSLHSISNFYDDLSFCDIALKQYHSQPISDWSKGRLSPGMTDLIATCENAHPMNSAECSDISADVEMRSLQRCCMALKESQSMADQLEDCPDLQSKLQLPMLETKQGVIAEDTQNQECIKSRVKKAADSAINFIHIINYNQRRSLMLDYLPCLRSISKTERLRQLAKTKRRFHHYFDGLGVAVKESTLDVFCDTFQ